MQLPALGFVLVSLIALGSIPKGEAQLLANLFGRPRHEQYQHEPDQGSVSAADSEAYNQDVQLGRLGLNRGITRSQTITQDEDGDTNAARTTSLTRGLNIGDLDVSSTLTGSKSYNNGEVNRKLGQNLNVGRLNVDSSLSRDNLKNGIFGIHRSPNGGLALDLGLLDIDLSRRGQPNRGRTGTDAQVQAIGDGARSNAISDINSHTDNFGKASSTLTHSKSHAMGSVLSGFTRGQAGGFAGGAPSYAAPDYFRRRRRVTRQAPFFFPGPQFNPYDGPGAEPFEPRREEQHGHRKDRHHHHRHEQGPVSDGYPGQNGFQGGNGFPGPVPRFPQQNGGFQNNNANAQGTAKNENPLFEQQSGANTQSHNQVNKFGQIQDNTGSSISSNIAKDGSSGQASSANTAQQNYQNAHGSGSKDASQSQSLNFGKDSTQATSSNAQTSHTKTDGSERYDSDSSSNVSDQNKFGSSTNTAQSKTENYKENGAQGTKSDASSQSIFQGKNGGSNAANAGANTQSVVGPDGSVTNTAKSQSSSFSNNGGSSSATSTSSSGFGPNGSFNNAQGFSNTGFAGSNAGAQSNNLRRHHG